MCIKNNNPALWCVGNPKTIWGFFYPARIAWLAQLSSVTLPELMVWNPQQHPQHTRTGVQPPGTPGLCLQTFWNLPAVCCVFQTYIGSVLVSVNPYKELEIYTKQNMERYRGVSFYEVSPHLWVVPSAGFVTLTQLKKGKQGISLQPWQC